MSTARPDSWALPADSPAQEFVTVKALLSCFFYLPYNLVFQDSIDRPDNAGSYAPVFSFLITHPTHGHTLFDLGVRKHAEGYPPNTRWIDTTRAAETALNDVADLLREGGIPPEDIKHVIISHLHWDHVGDPAPFTSADIVLGADAKSALATDVYPANPLGTVLQFPEDSKITFVDFVSADAPSRIISPFPSFDRALDFFGDGTLYLIDAPGHFKGHVAALARVAPGTFIFLGGDTCHNRQCYTPGTRLASETVHQDVGRARETIERLKTMNATMDEVVVVLAHEAEVLEEGMPMFPGDMRDWAVQRVAKRRSMRSQMVS